MSDSDDDWADAFDDKASPELKASKPTIVLSGIGPNPDAEEDWGDDFADAEEQSSPKSPKGDSIEASPLALRKSVWKIDFVREKESLDKLLAGLSQTLGTLKELTVPTTYAAPSSSDPNSTAWREGLPKLEAKIESAKATGEKFALSKAHCELGLLYQKHNDCFEALNEFDSALALLDDVDLSDPTHKVKAEFKATLQYQMGLNAKAMQDILQAVEFFTNAKKDLSPEANRDLWLKIQFELGYCYFKLDQFLKSLDFYNTFFRDAISTPTLITEQFESSCSALCNMAFCLHKLAETSLAKKFVKQGLSWSKGAFAEVEEKGDSLLKQITESDGRAGSNLSVRSTSESEKASEIEKEDLDGSNDSDKFWDDIVAEEASVPKFSLLLPENNDGDKANPKSEVAKYKLITEQKGFIAVKYPKPTILYSIKTKDGHTLLNETELASWLTEVIAKYKPSVLQLQESNKALGAQKKEFAANLAKHRAFSDKWMAIYNGFCHRMYLSVEYATECWSLLRTFFQDLKPHIVKQKSKTKTVEPHIFDRSLHVLHLACKMWRPDKDTDFKMMLEVTGTSHAHGSLLAPVVRAEIWSHYRQKDRDIVHVLCSAYNAAKKAQEKATDATLLIYIQARALMDLHLHLVDRSPLSGSRMKELLDESSSEESLSDPLCLDSVRMGVLIDLYPKLENSFIKAKCAFAMGLYKKDIEEDFEVAERLFFEAMYMLDQLEAPVSGVHAIISELGSNCIVQYGEMLHLNYKYKYAVHAFDAALLLYQIRGRRDDYFSLMRNVAKNAQEENDLNRAVDFYTEIVENYREYNGINEAIYVYEILCGLYLEMGQFKQATKCLTTASELLPDYTNFMEEVNLRTTNFDPLFVHLQIQLAKAHLGSYTYDNGIELLEKLSRCKIPHNALVTVTELLAKAYVKKRWFKEAQFMLSTWKDLLLVGRESQSSSSVFNAATKGSTAFEAAWWEHWANNYFKHRCYLEALACVDRVILLTQPSRYSALGKLFYLRAQILCNLCRSANLQYPTNLQPDPFTDIGGDSMNPPPLPDSPEDDSLRTLTYNAPADLLQECVTTARQAYQYFKATGDDIRIAKTVSLIADSYLDYIFWPLATQEHSFDEISQLAYFEVSIIASNTRERMTPSPSLNSVHSPVTSQPTYPSPEPTAFHNVLAPKKDQKDHGRQGSGVLKVRDKGHSRNHSDYSGPKNKWGPPMPGFGGTTKKPQRGVDSSEDSDTSTSSSVNTSSPARHKSQPRPKLNRDQASDSEVMVPEKREEKEPEKKDFAIKFQTIENAVQVALELCGETSNILLMLKAYIAMAELRFLQGKKDIAQAFWMECKESIISFFVDGVRPILHEAPPGFLERLLVIARRSVRLLFFFDKAVINKNLDLVDLYLILENDVEMAFRKPLPNSHDPSSNGSSSLPAHLTAILKARGNTASVARPKTATMDFSPSSSSPTTRISTDRKELDELALAARDNAGFIWGLLCFIKQQQIKYIEGKITSEQLKDRNQQCIKKLLRLVQVARSQEVEVLAEWNERLDHSVASLNRQASRKIIAPGAINFAKKDRERSDSMTAKSPRRTLSYAELAIDKSTILNKVLYVVQIDERVIHYVPMNGVHRMQRFGKKVDYANSSVVPAQRIFLKVELLDKSEESVTLVVPADAPLSTVLNYLCDTENWEDNQPKKKDKSSGGFFSTLRGIALPSSSQPEEIPIQQLYKSTNFYQEFLKLLSMIGDPSPKKKAPTSKRRSDKNRSDTDDSLEDSAGRINKKDYSSKPHIGRDSSPHRVSGDRNRRGSSTSSSSSQVNKDHDGSPRAGRFPVSLVSFAKRTAQSVGLNAQTIIPLRSKMQKRVHECFSVSEISRSSPDNPIKLYVYLSATKSKATTRTIAETLMFSEEVMSYLAGLVNQEKETDWAEDSTDQVIAELRHAFSPLLDILPVQVSEKGMYEFDEQKSAGLLSKLLSEPSKNVVPTHPLMLVCSKYMHAFPWELILPAAPVVRCSILDDLLTAENQRRKESRKSKKKTIARVSSTAITLLSCYFSSGEKSIRPIELLRKDWVIDSMNLSFNISSRPVIYVPENVPIFPYHSTLVRSAKKLARYRNKYKYVQFIDMLDFIRSPRDILSVLPSVNNPVFLFSYSDMLELSQTVMYLLRTRPAPPILFVPESKLKAVTTKLNKMQSSLLKAFSESSSAKSPPDHYQFVMSIVLAAQKELSCPIVLLNPRLSHK